MDIKILEEEQGILLETKKWLVSEIGKIKTEENEMQERVTALSKSTKGVSLHDALPI